MNPSVTIDLVISRIVFPFLFRLSYWPCQVNTHAQRSFRWNSEERSQIKFCKCVCTAPQIRSDNLCMTFYPPPSRSTEKSWPHFRLSAPIGVCVGPEALQQSTRMGRCP